MISLLELDFNNQLECIITRLEGRAKVTEQDRILQKNVFDEMIQDMKSKP